MESDGAEHLLGTGVPGTPDAAAKQLQDLDADRSALAGRLVAPPWLYPSFGALVALYIASPVLEPEVVQRAVVGVAIAAGALLVLAYQRISGVKVSRVGVRGAAVLGVLICATLLLLSTAYGLAAVGADWWIALPAVAGYGLVVVLGRRFDRLYREELRRGR